jgi:cytochrome d ubiquinol oxidase subunit I
MQYPVGYAVDEAAGRARLTDIWAVMSTDVVVWSYLHTVLGGLIAASVFVFAVSAYHLRRRQHLDLMRWTWRLAIIVGVSAGIGQAIVGDTLGAVTAERQPMKLAAGEALWESEAPAGLALIAWPDQEAEDNRFAIEIPYLLSLLATNTPDGEVKGIRDLQAEYEQRYGPGDYVPNVWVTFYAFRAMIGFGLIGVAWMALAGLLTRGGRLPTSRWFWIVSVWIVITPWLGNMFGWIYREVGRQPWVVFGELKTADAVSSLTPGMVTASLIAFYVLYGSFAVIEFRLLRRYAIKGPAEEDVRVEHEREMVVR